MVFTWDHKKNKINKAKHGLSFDIAKLVFEDPFHLSRMERVAENEERWQTLGQIEFEVVILVAHTYTESDGIERIRIISDRKATKKERQRYEEERCQWY